MIPRDAVVTLLSGKGKRGMTQREIGQEFKVTAYSAGMVVRALVASNEAYSYRDGNQVFFALHAAEPEPVVAAPVIVSPPYVNIWTKPLQYNFRAHADLAMAARSV